ncbi:hypothetical protein NM909_001081 [Staphylococcus pseudintermedius]|uniref:Uncharacterized protein n=1 Tax=Staphylococcus pseudintermedius TaxID=283734 RepID=A0A8H9C1H7_STAPS|nr:hypothetical protein [Staphylococcus pseudintermedius]EGQ0319763.1 hypothetical protein [Staphylococcus pseudintermedius]EGQ2840066.1 hypothetical protein [Staphylococcus pseudintermedius]EGQ3232845.1 hypothetical protein [Staphylococcus pseudintermedius]EGQ3463458.1 hypothetical protein [Staphylococcus pseudintermedius]EGQ3618802.1 hypothetical protein [Staphylococcus pseudintermedius]
MKSKIIRDINEDTFLKLKLKAQMLGISLNELINKILDEHVIDDDMKSVNLNLGDRIDLIEKSMQEIQVNQISLNFKLATLIDLFDLVYGIDEIDERNEFNIEEMKKYE